VENWNFEVKTGDGKSFSRVKMMLPGSEGKNHIT
jgi:hypothetical protein